MYGSLNENGKLMRQQSSLITSREESTTINLVVSSTQDTGHFLNTTFKVILDPFWLCSQQQTLCQTNQIDHMCDPLSFQADIKIVKGYLPFMEMMDDEYTAVEKRLIKVKAQLHLLECANNIDLTHYTIMIMIVYLGRH